MNAKNEPLFSRWGYTLDTGQKRVNVVYQDRLVPTPNPKLTLDALNHPIFAWAEMESFRLTGDKDRLRLVWEPLTRYYAALQKYLRQGNGLYLTDWASMDNSTRNPYLETGRRGNRYLVRNGPVRPEPRPHSHDPGKGIRGPAVPPGRRGACHAHQSTHVGRAAEILYFD